jgi:non-specific serine/threonine protein kinase
LAELWAAKDPPWWVDQLKSAVERSSSELKKVRAEAAWKEGLAMDLNRAVDYAFGPNFLKPHGSPGHLSRRELDVVGLVAKGMTNHEIGSRLFISERTVEGHLDRIRNKLDVGTRTEVATWAFANGVAEGSGC